MKRFKDWGIRRKLMAPLFAVMILGGGGIFWVLTEMHATVWNDSLLEERALHGIRRVSSELLNKYYELMLGHSEAIEREIGELQEEIGKYRSNLANWKGGEEGTGDESGFLEDIDTSGRKIIRIGDETIAVRLRQLDHMKAMEEFKELFELSPAGSLAGAEAVEDRQVPELDGLVQEYISVLGDYVLLPNGTTRQEIQEFDGRLEEILRAYGERGSDPGNSVLDADDMAPIRRLLEAGRLSVSLTTEYLARRDELEAKHDELLTVLDEVGIAVAKKTDKAFETSFTKAGFIISAVLAIIILVTHKASKKTELSVLALADAAGRFGAGDLNSRADERTNDEIGGLATSFNRMATRVELNIAQRSHAERALTAAHAEMERRVESRTLELKRSNEALLHEMTERISREKELANKRAIVEATFNAMDQGISMYDADLMLAASNTRFLELLELPPEQFQVGTPFINFVRFQAERGEYGSVNVEGIVREKVLEATRRVSLRYERRRPDGTVIEYRRNPLPQGGMVTTYTDVTERVQAEESHAKIEQQLLHSQKMDAVGQLTGGIAHDFNNLLMVIDGYSKRAVQSIGDEQATKECLERVISASDKAANLTKQLLVFSRQQVMEKRAIAVARVLEETLELLKRSVGERFELALDISDDSICVETDPGQLSQAIMNLIINARDAMPQGGRIDIGLRTAELDEDFVTRHNGLAAGTYAEIYVGDQGTGIDADTLEHIFEPFFTTKEQGKGTGLGLAMVYGLAQQCGGIVDVTSEHDVGSTFQIYMPLTDRVPEADVSQVEAGYYGRGETILLVEDDEALLDLAGGMLEELGYTVLRAEDGLAALEIEENHEGPIGLLLSDVVMPNLGGFELATILAETSPDMKVVFMSGYPGRESLQNLGIPDHAAFLQKPVKPEVLAKTIREVLDAGDLRLVG